MGFIRQILYHLRPPDVYDRSRRVGDLTGGRLCPVHLGKVLEAIERFHEREREMRANQELRNGR